MAIVNEKSASDRDMVNAQFQQALTSRLVLEQAKGVLASSGQLDMRDAFTVLRSYARHHGHKLSAVAEQLVNREMRGQELLDYARSASHPALTASVWSQATGWARTRGENRARAPDRPGWVAGPRRPG